MSRAVSVADAIRSVRLLDDLAGVFRHGVDVVSRNLVNDTTVIRLTCGCIIETNEPDDFLRQWSAHDAAGCSLWEVVVAAERAQR